MKMKKIFLLSIIVLSKEQKNEFEEIIELANNDKEPFFSCLPKVKIIYIENIFTDMHLITDYININKNIESNYIETECYKISQKLEVFYNLENKILEKKINNFKKIPSGEIKLREIKKEEILNTVYDYNFILIPLPFIVDNELYLSIIYYRLLKTLLIINNYETSCGKEAYDNLQKIIDDTRIIEEILKSIFQNNNNNEDIILPKLNIIIHMIIHYIEKIKEIENQLSLSKDILIKNHIIVISPQLLEINKEQLININKETKKILKKLENIKEEMTKIPTKRVNFIFIFQDALNQLFEYANNTIMITENRIHDLRD